MSGNSFEQMKGALTALNKYSLAEGSLVYGEIKAYAAAIDSVYDELEKTLKEIFVATAESCGLEMRETVLDIINSGGAQSRREKITELLTRRHGTFDKAKFLTMLSRISNQVHLYGQNGILCVSGARYLTLEQLCGLSRLIKDNLSPISAASLLYNGHSFEYWEEMNKNWNSIDRGKLMFSFFETAY